MWKKSKSARSYFSTAMLFRVISRFRPTTVLYTGVCCCLATLPPLRLTCRIPDLALHTPVQLTFQKPCPPWCASTFRMSDLRQRPNCLLACLLLPRKSVPIPSEAWMMQHFVRPTGSVLATLRRSFLVRCNGASHGVQLRRCSNLGHSITGPSTLVHGIPSRSRPPKTQVI